MSHDLYIAPNELFIVENEKIHKQSHIEAVEHLMKVVDKKPMWEVIDTLVSMFTRLYNSELNEVANREIKLINEYGATKDLSSRFIGTIPERLMNAIDFFYSDEINADRKKFTLEFFKRYPAFRVANKL